MIIPLIALLLPIMLSAMQSVPTLVDLCLSKLNAIPYEQFPLFKNLPQDLKQKYIIRYGPTYTPNLFNLITNDGEHATSGPVTDELLILKNYSAIVTICKNQPSEPENHSTPCLVNPDFSYAYLHNETIYIGTNSGSLHHYTIQKQRPHLINAQQLDSAAITYITVHPQQKDVICGKDSNGYIQLYKKNNGIWQTLITFGNRQAKHISLSSSEPLLLACAEQTKIWLYTIIPPPIPLAQVILLPIDTIQTLFFDQNGNLLVQGTKNSAKIPRLFVWDINADPDPVPYHMIWPNTTKININQSIAYGSDADFDTDKWLTKTANTILFLASLKCVSTQHDLKHFKQHCDTLYCDQEPLFKVLALKRKSNELVKAIKK